MLQEHLNTMVDRQPVSRRGFLKRSFAFSAAAALNGCGWGVANRGDQDPVTGGISHILAVGDWGTDDGTADQSHVASAMQKYVAKWEINTDALLMLGDNFYGDMPGVLNSPRWQTNFEQMYPAPVFNCPAYAVPGNHDYQNTPDSKVEGELAYAAQGTSRWTMPEHHYTFTFPFNSTNPVVTFHALDTNFAGEPAQPWPPPDASYYGQNEADRGVQAQWLAGELAKPLTTPFRFVIGHHPLYSNGPHGDNATLIHDVDSLFRQAGVHMYMAGHDHDLQHLEFSGHPTSFVNSGGGGAELNSERASEQSRGPYFGEAHGFTHIQVRPDIMIVRHLDTSGNLLHRFSKTPAGVVTIQK